MKTLVLAFVAMFVLTPATLAAPRDRWVARVQEFDRRVEYRREWVRNPSLDRNEEFKRRQDFRRDQYERLYAPYGPRPKR